MKRYIHIFPDDKFVDYVIDNCELTASGENEYYIWGRRNTDSFLFVKSKAAIHIPSAEAFFKYTNSYLNDAKVFIHSLRGLALHIVPTLPKNICVVWIFWGSDGYALPSLRNYLYMPKTQRLMYKLDNINPWKARVKYIIDEMLISKHRTFKALQRVNICATWIKYDYELVKRYNKGMRYEFFNNNSVEQLIEGIENFSPENVPLRVWVGNSGDPTNNHLDIFSKLESKKWPGEVMCVLSYGDKKEYIEKVIEIGKNTFYEKFVPLTEYLDKVSYHKMFLSSEYVILNHKRQQAANNAIVALWFGKKVFMNKVSPLYKTFKEWGLNVYDFTNFPRTDKLDHQLVIENNREILIKYLGQKNILDSFQRLLS